MIGETFERTLPHEGGLLRMGTPRLGELLGFRKRGSRWPQASLTWPSTRRCLSSYLKQMSPWFGFGNHGIYAGLFVVVTCAVLNLAGIRVVESPRCGYSFLLSAPFALIVVMAPLKMGTLAETHTAPAATGAGLARRHAGGDVELHGMG